MIAIGIDPGTTTGVGVWDKAASRLTMVASMRIHEAMKLVETEHRAGRLHIVHFEDARLRTWFGSAGREKLQGVGSVKRDCAVWADFLTDLGAKHRSIKPQSGGTKWDAARFAQVTGWTERTDEHGRDAALLVWGM